MAACKIWLPALAALLLGGCAVREDVAHSQRQGFDRLTREPWGARLAEFSGISAVIPSYTAQERAADAELCHHPRGSNRVVRQEGVEDSVAARRCAVSPYPRAGYRLRGR